MNYHEINAARLREALDSIATAPRSRRRSSEVMKTFREALLLFGSHTDDNCLSAKQIELIPHNDGHVAELALSVVPSGITLSDIIYAVESLPLPDQVAKDLPTLSEAEWSAAMRVIVLILKSFEHRKELEE